ncbi:adenosylcobinamide-phosphate synthase CbiB [Ruminococcus hominis]|uniref:Cobalamin biosynthesis protein CobD n=1 Tax=Ruminococcus hominis TaxID=2763065 RepID=A0ABR7G7M2_9FIRM|nr:adenosylcobinamide-phosphate synthase CbiB [Ruminococcus hominis]MBC5683434.1 cobalamin biosynthesis protein CobD [Ruminococcus hominis]
MISLVACIGGFCLDFLFGDPVWLYHPVRIMGNVISLLEKAVRKISRNSKSGLLIGGAVLWGIVVILFTGIPYGVLEILKSKNEIAAFLLEMFWCYQLLAAKSLKTESMKVYMKLKDSDLEGARKAVSMIVGRDTANLDCEGITKATVETIAENTSDGVIAPLFYMLIGGAPLGMLYKAINTMDSMLGYKDEKYLYIGRIAAKMDDLVNYIPARISAIVMVLASFLCGLDWKNAWKIFLRDRYNHSSPNSAQTEAVCAGALDIQLAGDAWYFGKLYKKPYIGEPIRSIRIEDICQTNRLMYVTAIVTMIIFGTFKLLFYII